MSLTKIRNSMNKDSGYINVMDFGAVGDGVTDDTLSVQSALLSATNDSIVVFGYKKKYLITDTINVQESQTIDFNYSTLKFTGTTVCLNCNFSNYADVNLKNLGIEMTDNSLTQKGINLYKVSRGNLSNISMTGGAYGIYSVNSYMYTVNNFMHGNPKLSGYYHQGDNGCELTFSDWYITFSGGFTGKYGIEIERTTSNDVGGYYCNNVLVVAGTGSTAEQGIYLHSSADNISVIVWNMIDGGADGFSNISAGNGYFALKLENVAAVRCTNTWISSVGFVSRTDHTIFGDSNVAYGFWFTATAVSNAPMLDNISCAEGNAIHIDNLATITNLYYKNLRHNPTVAICDNLPKLVGAYATEQNKIHTDTSNSNASFCIESANNTAYKKFFRIDTFNQLVLLNSDYSQAIWQINDGGTLRMIDGASIIIDNKQVVQERIGGWGTSTGTALKTAFDTGTVTTEELAKRVKALIDDLGTHGLIGP